MFLDGVSRFQAGPFTALRRVAALTRWPQIGEHVWPACNQGLHVVPCVRHTPAHPALSARSDESGPEALPRHGEDCCASESRPTAGTFSSTNIIVRGEPTVTARVVCVAPVGAFRPSRVCGDVPARVGAHAVPGSRLQEPDGAAWASALHYKTVGLAAATAPHISELALLRPA